MRVRRFIYSTRGLYLLVALAAILWLKHRLGAGVPSLPRLVLVLLTIGAQLFRTWAAGFIGTTARGRETQAEILLTAGPYACVCNP